MSEALVENDPGRIDPDAEEPAPATDRPARSASSMYRRRLASGVTKTPDDKVTVTLATHTVS